MKYTKESEYSMVKYLRFMNNKPHLTRNTYMSLKDIAKFLNKSASYVHTLCKLIIRDSKDSNIKCKVKDRKESIFDQYLLKKKKHFTEEQIRYLTSDRILT